MRKLDSIIKNNKKTKCWECINTNFGMCNTWRMKVPHGWIVEGDHDDHTLAMIFYPDETHEWRL